MHEKIQTLMANIVNKTNQELEAYKHYQEANELYSNACSACRISKDELYNFFLNNNMTGYYVSINSTSDVIYHLVEKINDKPAYKGFKVDGIKKNDGYGISKVEINYGSNSNNDTRPYYIRSKEEYEALVNKILSQI